jgi:iron complex outermembrane receptor protein
MTVPVALAQQAEEGTLEEVVITGSRIRQNPLEERLPVLTLDSEEYRATGATSLAEFVQRLPISGSAINASNNASGNLGFPPDGGGIGAGAAEFDLRYLTSKRVLVLVDGRRWVKGSSGSGVAGAVDLNSIPANAVKSIEILQDGASAVYGSDAIGGVLNIITQDDYDSLKISGYTGQYEQGDGETSEFDVRFGGRGERGRALVDISYADQKAVSTQDREESVFALPGFPFGISGGIPAGRFVFVDPVAGEVDVVPNQTSPTPVWDPNDQANDDFHDFTDADRFAYQPFNHLITPNERVNVFGKAEFDVSDNVMFRALASFNNRKSQGQAAPVPLFFGPAGGSTPYMVNIVWPANHPFNPFGIDFDSSNLPFVGRRPTEAGPRIFNQDVDTWYVSGGFDGEFELGTRRMYWDVTAIRAENKATQVKLNQFNARSLNVALGDPAVCAAIPGCLPINIVGEGSMTQEMLDFVTYTGLDQSSQTLTDVSANLSGDLFNMPAGPLGFAIGVEHREEAGSFTPDPVVTAGETADVPTSPTVGGYDVDELYGEVIVPLLKDAPAANVLNVSAAIRYTDSDLFGSEEVGKLALNWGPTENLMLRASFSEGFRAPNIGELFNQGSRFDSSISDECSLNTTPTVPVPANCATLGVPPGYSQLNPQVSVDTGGNINLEPETADTFAAGFTWDAPVANWGALERLLVEVNYYDIDIDGAIQAPDAQDLLDGCIDTLEPIFCDAINRIPGGTITSIAGVLQNIGGIETSGVDINFDLSTAETGLGRFRFQWMTSLLLDYDELFVNTDGSFDRVDRKGVELGSPTRGFVETKSSLNTDWYWNEWTVRLGFRYLSSLTEQCVGLVADLGQTDFCSNGPDTNELDSVFYTDLQVSWQPSALLGGGWTFTAGVNNLLDESPPICFSCDLNSLDGTLYPIGGQFMYLRATYEK